MIRRSYSVPMWQSASTLTSMYGTDKLYKDALISAGKWYWAAMENQEDANYWYLVVQKKIHLISDLKGLAIFQGLVILGLLTAISIILHG